MVNQVHLVYNSLYISYVFLINRAFGGNQPSVSKIELLEQTKLSVSTLTRMLEEMCAKKLTEPFSEL